MDTGADPPAASSGGAEGSVAERSAPMEGGCEGSSDAVVVQYVVMRRDLWTEMGWPLGSVVAQACHACTAAVWGAREEACVRGYLAPENVDSMHKVGVGDGRVLRRRKEWKTCRAVGGRESVAARDRGT